MKSIISTTSAPSAIGPYSQAVKTGNMLYTSGQIAISPETGKLIEGGIREQTEQVMKNLQAVLKTAGKGFKAYKTWGFAVACAAGLDMDEETAYKIVKAICEDKTEQAAAFSGVKGADFVDMTLKYATSPLHPGAIRYFKEKGKSIPDYLME